MSTINISDARSHLPDVITTAQTQPVTLERHGQAVAVIISPARYEQLLAIAEDIEDIEAAEAALREEGPNIPWDEVKADLGL